MKKLFTLFFALAASITFASATIYTSVLIDGLCYDLDDATLTATVVRNGDMYQSLTSVIIPDTVVYNEQTFDVKAIGYNAFFDCSSLQTVQLPEGLTHIGVWAFISCSALTSINLHEGLTYIGKEALSGCGFTHLEVPSSVTYLGEGVFEEDHNLSSIVLHCTMDTLPHGIFENCYSLDSVVVPQGVKSISRFAFYQCRALTHVELPEGLKSIQQHAFAECKALEEIELPASLDTIGQYVFTRSASSIICKAITPPRVHEEAFASGSMSSLQVPKQSMEAYKAADVWKNFRFIYPIYGEEEEAAFAGWTKYDNAHYDDSFGFWGESFNWGIMIPTDSIRGNKLTQVALFETRANKSEITLSVVSGGATPASGQLLHTESFMPVGEGFHIIAFENPIVIDPTQNLWIYFSEGIDELPAAMDYTASNPNAMWIGAYDMWMNTDWSEYPCAFMIRANIPSTEGVENVQNDKAQSTKILRDGQILILRNGKTYNAVGAEIKN